MPTDLEITVHDETTCTVSVDLPGCFSLHFKTDHIPIVEKLLSALHEMKGLEDRAWAALAAEWEDADALTHSQF